MWLCKEKLRLYNFSMRARKVITGFWTMVLAASMLVFVAPSAQAGCRDFPESITPECVAQNLAEEKIKQEAATAQRAQDLIDAEERAKANAELEYVRNGSRPCTIFPASITPECAAENLAYEKSRQVDDVAKRAQDLLDAEERARANAELEYIRNGSRPCTLFPASITPACVAENLEYEKERQGLAEKNQIAALEKAIKAEAQAQKEQYIRNGSRPCSLYPAAITPECVAENLEYEEIRKVEAEALITAKEAASGATFNTLDENGSLLVVAKVPAKVDLLSTTVKLLNSKGKVLDTGVIRYQSSGEPYFVFDNFKGKGSYTVQMSLPKKKFSTLKIKVT
jgi:hypothetical protein